MAPFPGLFPLDDSLSFYKTDAFRSLSSLFPHVPPLLSAGIARQLGRPPPVRHPWPSRKSGTRCFDGNWIMD